IQKSWRRLFAYSSVAHSGYLLLGLAAALQQGIGAQAVLAYLAAYSVMTLGVFAAIATLHGSYDKDLQLSDLRGLTQRSPWVGISLSICLLSLIGIPLTAGFWAKFNIFQIAVTANDSLLLFGAVVMAINAVIGAVYYLSLLASINGWDSTKETKPLEISFASPATVACVACAVITLLWFVFPKWM
ncbi:MAG: NADH-quinone oxidoreductase subunit, partial [Planctomycetota bacterium]